VRAESSRVRLSRKAIAASSLVARRSVKLVHLHGDPVLIHQRIAARKGHFMKPAMLNSQLADLEPPRDALVLDIAGSTAEIVTKIRAHYSL